MVDVPTGTCPIYRNKTIAEGFLKPFCKKPRIICTKRFASKGVRMDRKISETGKRCIIGCPSQENDPNFFIYWTNRTYYLRIAHTCICTYLSVMHQKAPVEGDAPSLAGTNFYINSYSGIGCIRDGFGNALNKPRSIFFFFQDPCFVKRRTQCPRQFPNIWMVCRTSMRMGTGNKDI